MDSKLRSKLAGF